MSATVVVMFIYVVRSHALPRERVTTNVSEIYY